MEVLKLFLFIIMILFTINKTKESFINYTISNENPEKNMRIDYFFKEIQSDIQKADYDKVYDMYEKIDNYDFSNLTNLVCFDDIECINYSSSSPIMPDDIN